jgi:hypothetical protein
MFPTSNALDAIFAKKKDRCSAVSIQYGRRGRQTFELSSGFSAIRAVAFSAHDRCAESFNLHLLAEACHGKMRLVLVEHHILLRFDTPWDSFVAL